ncbi:hypothetical protein ADU59_17470 [Pararhizobium polonicum]|uniref:Uncharacterized protein n=1 Tax=Pararhizobium polonicum TaxID=1612624 RepID=A0A1C7NZK2_9HYPH|nr:hypothetical protein ADU59_17470 [Pararhizobium polonicum]
MTELGVTETCKAFAGASRICLDIFSAHRRFFEKRTGALEKKAFEEEKHPSLIINIGGLGGAESDKKNSQSDRDDSSRKSDE